MGEGEREKQERERDRGGEAGCVSCAGLSLVEKSCDQIFFCLFVLLFHCPFVSVILLAEKEAIHWRLFPAKRLARDDVRGERERKRDKQTGVGINKHLSECVMLSSQRRLKYMFSLCARTHLSRMNPSHHQL